MPSGIAILKIEGCGPIRYLPRMRKKLPRIQSGAVFIGLVFYSN